MWNFKNKDRFFIVFFIANGKNKDGFYGEFTGQISFTISNGKFLNKAELTDAIIEYNREYELDDSVTITGIQELNKSDYNNWLK